MSELSVKHASCASATATASADATQRCLRNKICIILNVCVCVCLSTVSHILAGISLRIVCRLQHTQKQMSLAARRDKTATGVAVERGVKGGGAVCGNVVQKPQLLKA